MSPSLPRIILLKSNHECLQYHRNKSFCVRHCAEPDTFNNIHLCSEHDIASAYAKFELVKVNPGKGLYRIKCCINNKFWSCGGDKGLVQATEKEAVDSTLFKIEPVDTDMNTYRFMCMEFQSYVRLADVAFKRRTDLFLTQDKDSSGNHPNNFFTVINWESLVILPKNVAFKTNNDHYVIPGTYPPSDFYHSMLLQDGLMKRQENHLYADQTTDIGDRRAEHQIITLSDQKICVKNNFANLFWTYDPSYRKRHRNVYCDFLAALSDDTSRPESQFVPIRPGKDTNLIALRNVAKNTLCYRDGGHLVLTDNSDRTPFEEAKVLVEELVLSRKVCDVDFRFDNSFIDDQSIQLTKRHGFSINDLDTDVRENIPLDFEEAIHSSYDTSVSVKTISGVSLDVTAPLLADVLYFTPSAAFTAEKENRYSWGKVSETSFKIGVVMNVNVSPKTKMTAEMDVTKAICNIPFSYTQRDLTTRGEYVVEVKEDGVYTCKNCYIFDIKLTEEALN